MDPSGHASQWCTDKEMTVSYLAEEDGTSLKKAEKKYEALRNSDEHKNKTAAQFRKDITGIDDLPPTNGKMGNYDYNGPLPNDSWILSMNGDGAHLVERSSVAQHPELFKFDQNDTPRFYPYGSVENAGQAHLRLHEATKAAGIELQGGNPSMPYTELLGRYNNAYSSLSLDGIRGDLRNPSGTKIIAWNVTPKEAYRELIKWSMGGKK